MPSTSSKSSQMSPLKIVLSIVIIIVAAFFGIDVLDLTSQTDSAPAQTEPAQQPAQQPSTHSAWSTGAGSVADSQQELVKLVKAERSGQMVEFSARVVKVLNDDNDGARHQRFLLAIDFSPSPAKTILVAHNIDLAPRVPISEDSTIRIYGQYEWNDRGGVVHWTHHDPGGRHADGWIELDGQRYD